MDKAKLLFSFYGRIGRPAFWMGGMAALVLFYLGYMATLAPDLMTNDGTAKAIASLGPLMMLISLIAATALHVKRLHDRGRSGWFVLILLGPLYSAGSFVTGYGALDPSLDALSLAIHAVNFAAAIYFAVDLGCLDGDREPNRFDEEPDFSFLIGLLNKLLAQANIVLGEAKNAASTAVAAQRAQAPQTASFANVEAALERAIAAQKEAPAPAKPAGAQRATRPAPSPPTGPKSFGRRA